MKTIILIIGIGSATIASAVNVAGTKELRAPIVSPIAVSVEEVKKEPPTAPLAREIMLAGYANKSDVHTEATGGSATFDAATIGETVATTHRHADAGWEVHQATYRCTIGAE